MLDTIINVLFGTGTGILGSLLGAGVKHFQHRQALELRRLDIDIAEREVAAEESLRASYGHDAGRLSRRGECGWTPSGR